MASTALVGDVAEKLGRWGIPIMPIKGALLQHWLYDDPMERSMTDVDLLVPRAGLVRAVEVLEAHGYRPTPYSSVGGVVMRTPFNLCLDLHSQLFERERYRMATADVFARSSEDRDLFGVAVRVPFPLDAYAHLIGKFGSDHLNASSVGRLDEIARMGLHLDSSVEATAGHLVLCGMRRVADYTLSLVGRVTDDELALRVRESLPFDALSPAVSALAERVLSKTSPASNSGAIMAHLLNESIPRGLYSGLTAWLRRPRA